MCLTREMAAQGKWMFRWRSYLPLLFLPIVVTAVLATDHPQSRRWELACLAISFAGILLRCLSVGTVPARTSGRNTLEQVADELNTTGMYSVVRHPLYLANYVVAIGFCLTSYNAWLVIAFSLSFWLYYERIAITEESFLDDKFDDAFRDWAKTTPAFIPDFRLWQTPQLTFSPRTVIRREYSTLMLATSVHFGLHTLHLKTNSVDPIWIAMILTTLAAYLIARTLKRNSIWLTVPGR